MDEQKNEKEELTAKQIGLVSGGSSVDYLEEILEKKEIKKES